MQQQRVLDRTLLFGAVDITTFYHLVVIVSAAIAAAAVDLTPLD
jgi:hypothetical protein